MNKANIGQCRRDVSVSSSQLSQQTTMFMFSAACRLPSPPHLIVHRETTALMTSGRVSFSFHQVQINVSALSFRLGQQVGWSAFVLAASSTSFGEVEARFIVRKKTAVRLFASACSPRSLFSVYCRCSFVVLVRALVPLFSISMASPSRRQRHSPNVLVASSLSPSSS